MKTSRIIASMSFLFLLCFALAGGLYSQDEEPDLQVQDSDISFSPSDRVMLKDKVEVRADIHNVENSYVVLSENNDAIGFDISYDPYDVLQVRVRARSTNGEALVMQVRMDHITSNIFYSVNADWTQCTCEGFNAPGFTNSTMYIERNWGSEEEDLEIDWIQVYKYVNFVGWEHVATWEAETYEDGGDTVDWIYPCNVQMNFYDGDPGSGGSKFASVANIGNLQRTIESGSVSILTEDGKKQATAYWKAKPLGWHEIFVEVVPCERETVTDNNMASKEIEVVLMYVRVLNWFGQYVPW
ncbi:MAG: hypothetical protein ACYTG7_14690 [Planctomycetota bacterium]|jgi:hypothetical protein